MSAESEHPALERRRHAASLVAASETLARASSPSAALAEIARIVVRDIADWAAILGGSADGASQLLAFAHRDPAAEAGAEEAVRLYLEVPGAPVMARRVMTSRTPELIVDADPAAREAVADNDALAKVMRLLSPRSWVICPLVARDAVHGTLIAVRGEGPALDLHDLALVEQVARYTAASLDNERLVQAERSAREAAERQQALAAALSAAATLEEVAAAGVTAGRAALEARGVVVVLRQAASDGEDVVQLLAQAGYSAADLEGLRTLPVSAELPITRAVRTGEPCFVSSPDQATDQFPRLKQGLAQRSGAWATVPFISGGRAVGALGIAFTRPRVFGDAERALLVSMGRQIGQALDRARLLDAERQARERAERAEARTRGLQEATVRIAGALSPPALAAVIGETIVPIVGAHHSYLWTVSGDALRLVGEPVIEAAHRDRITVLRIADDYIMGLAAMRRQPVFIESLADYERRFPRSPHRDLWRSAGMAVAAVPLVVGARLLGVMALVFDADRRFGDAERAFLVAMGQPCAQALDRALLFEEERRERLARQLLADCGAALAGQLDARAAVSDVVGLMVRDFGDTCVVDLVRDDGSRERIAQTRDAAAGAAVPGNLLARAGRPDVELVTNPGDGLLVGLAAGGPELEQLRKLPPRSWLTAPLVVHGRRAGVLWLGSRTRVYDGRDLGLALDVARRTGLTLEHARLYQAQVRLQQLTAALARATTVADVAGVGLELGAAAVGAISGALWIVDGDVAELVLSRNVPEDYIAAWRHIPLDGDEGVAQVVRDQRALWVESIEDYQRQAPAAVGRARAAGRAHVTFAALPMMVEGRAAGVISFRLADGHRFTVEERSLVATVVELCAQALVRARLYETERRLAREAQAANRAKDEFLAMLGHELRNPLAPILTALQVMRLRGEQVLEHERAVIERQARHLARLLDDLFDVSRIVRGALELRREPLEVGDVVARAIEMASPVIETRRHTMAIAVPASGLLVDGDPARLAQLVTNLLVNAARYTPPGGRIEVAVTIDEGAAVLTVADNGAGMSPELVPRAFEFFVQGERNAERSEGGLGLGLGIARSITELHGGAIAIQSLGRDRGTTVTVRLPLLAERPAAAAAPARGPVAGGASLRILIVDDNVDAAEMLAESMRLLGHEPAVAHDGPLALAAALERPPDLAIVDLGLPLIDGWEVARRMRASPVLCAVRLIALSGYGQPQDLERSRDAGFEAHLVKPVDLDAIQSLLAATAT